MPVAKIRVERVTETLTVEVDEDTQVRRRAEGFEAALRDPDSKLRRAIDALPTTTAIVRSGR